MAKPISAIVVGGRFNVDGNAGKDDSHYFDVRSLVYNYRLVGRGTVTNPEVCQLITPASLRAEHPLATLVGWCGGLVPDFNSLQKLADHMTSVQGAFLFIALCSTGNRAIACVRNLPMTWSNEKGAFIPTASITNKVWMLSAEADGRIESLDLPVEAKVGAGKKLFVVESFADEDWTRRWRKSEDVRVSYSQIDYKGVHTHVDKGRHGPWYLNLVSRCLAFALEFPTDKVPKAIVLGITPKECDLLLLSSLTRVVWAATNGSITLECPVYEVSIGHRITETY